MRVFVTGATGFIGRHLTERLRSGGHTTTVLALPVEDVPEDDRYSVVRGDITDRSTLVGKLDGHDAIVHLAGAVGYGQTFERCNAINRDGTENMALAATAAGISRFVHMSSVSVYGRVDGVRLDEDAPLKKIGDPYGDTKIDAERALETIGADGALDVTMLRPTVIYGPGDDKFLPKLVENLKSGRARVIGSGNNSVDLIHVTDAVELICRCLEDPRAMGRVYNLTHPSNPTWSEFIAEAARLVGVAPPKGRLPYPVAYVAAAMMELIAKITGSEPRLTRYAVRVVGRQYHYSVDRAREELGFEPKIDLFTGLAECLDAAGSLPEER